MILLLCWFFVPSFSNFGPVCRFCYVFWLSNSLSLSLHAALFRYDSHRCRNFHLLPCRNSPLSPYLVPSNRPRLLTHLLTQSQFPINRTPWVWSATSPSIFQVSGCELFNLLSSRKIAAEFFFWVNVIWDHWSSIPDSPFSLLKFIRMSCFWKQNVGFFQCLL